MTFLLMCGFADMQMCRFFEWGWMVFLKMPSLYAGAYFLTAESAENAQRYRDFKFGRRIGIWHWEAASPGIVVRSFATKNSGGGCYCRFFSCLLFNNDFIWVMAMLFSCINLSDCVLPW